MTTRRASPPAGAAAESTVRSSTNAVITRCHSHGVGDGAWARGTRGHVYCGVWTDAIPMDIWTHVAFSKLRSAWNALLSVVVERSNVLSATLTFSECVRSVQPPSGSGWSLPRGRADCASCHRRPWRRGTPGHAPGAADRKAPGADTGGLRGHARRAYLRGFATGVVAYVPT